MVIHPQEHRVGLTARSTKMATDYSMSREFDQAFGTTDLLARLEALQWRVWGLCTRTPVLPCLSVFQDSVVS